jgi:hypothetical protein
MASPASTAALLATGVLATVASVVAVERATAALASWGGAGLFFVGAALLLFATVAAYLSRGFGRPTWLVGASLGLGVVAGVLLDVTLDSIWFGGDRNLFPFEIVVLWILALGPALWASMAPDALDRLLGIVEGPGKDRNGRAG